jgi:hypothetical protein
VITCPIRFRQEWQISRDAGSFFFPDEEETPTLSEVRLRDVHGESAGNIDMVICQENASGRITDFGALEIQAVYISGNVREPFQAYMDNQKVGQGLVWTGPYYPRPDYLSSSRKRLVPQLQFKGGILNHWGKKMAVALDEHFFATLPAMPHVSVKEAEIAWFIYGMRLDQATNTFTLQLQRTIYTTFAESLAAISVPKPGIVDDFVAELERKKRRC